MRYLTFFLLYVLMTVSSVCAQTTEPLTDSEKIADLATLWSEAKYNFVHFDRVPELDWDQTFKVYIPKVLETESTVEYVRVLQQFYALLKEGHTNVVPPVKFNKIYGINPPVELDVIENKPVVINISADLSKYLPIGSVITAVDGVPSRRYLEESVLPYISAATDHDRLRKAIQGGGEPAVGLLTRPAGEKVRVTFEAPSGDIRKYTIDIVEPDSSTRWVDTPLQKKKLFNLKWLDGEIALITINGFYRQAVVDDFRKSIPELEKARAFIIDVRKNPGGSSSLGFEIAKHFTDLTIKPYHWNARKHVSVYRAWGRYADEPEYRKYYKLQASTDADTVIVAPAEKLIFRQPVVVLSGSDVYSAAEDFLSYMSQINRVKIVGGPSAGSTGQPLILSLNAAYAAITSKRDMLPDGTPIVGNGIAPDLEVYQTVEAFRKGRDLVVEKAVEILTGQLNGKN